jgi:hypothetical protein
MSYRANTIISGRMFRGGTGMQAQFWAAEQASREDSMSAQVVALQIVRALSYSPLITASERDIVRAVACRSISVTLDMARTKAVNDDDDQQQRGGAGAGRLRSVGQQP